MIHFQCPSCERTLRIPDELAGRTAVCPSCKTKVRIPQPESGEEDEPEQEAIAPPTPQLVKSSRSRRPAPDEDEAPAQDSPRQVDEEVDELEEVEEPDEVESKKRQIDEDDDDDKPRRRTGRKRRRIVRTDGGRERITWWASLSLLDKVAFSAFGAGMAVALLAAGLPPLVFIAFFLAAVLLLTAIVEYFRAAAQSEVGCGVVIPVFVVLVVFRERGSVKHILYAIFGLMVAGIGLGCANMGASVWHSYLPHVRMLPW